MKVCRFTMAVMVASCVLLAACAGTGGPGKTGGGWFADAAQRAHEAPGLIREINALRPGDAAGLGPYIEDGSLAVIVAYMDEGHAGDAGAWAALDKLNTVMDGEYGDAFYDLVYVLDCSSIPTKVWFGHLRVHWGTGAATWQALAREVRDWHLGEYEAARECLGRETTQEGREFELARMRRSREIAAHFDARLKEVKSR